MAKVPPVLYQLLTRLTSSSLSPLSLSHSNTVNNVRHSNAYNNNSKRKNNMKLPKVGLHVPLLLMDFICTCYTRFPVLSFPYILTSATYRGGWNGIVLSTFCYVIPTLCGKYLMARHKAN